MIDRGEPSVVEYNARMGDPETHDLAAQTLTELREAQAHGLQLPIEIRAIREAELGRLGWQHRGHVAARVDVVGADIVLELDDHFRHNQAPFRGSVMTPVMAEAAATTGLQR